jgi:putative tributyrin esterase
MKSSKARALALLLSSILQFSACEQKTQEMPADHPRLAPNVTMRDVTFHSIALDRSMQYRVVMPQSIAGGKNLPVVYLLHGGGGNFRDWSNYSDVASFAENGLILVMPEGDESYYTNSAERPQDRYEDYITKDLIDDVEGRFPAAKNRMSRAIIGISMGGFGAVKLALKYPELFVFTGGLSSALDVPTRPFSFKRYSQWKHHRSIFGPWNGSIQQANDPFVLARTADPAQAPYLFLTCGDEEGLLGTNRKFAELLETRHFRYEFHVVKGAHNWDQWNRQLAACFRRIFERLPVYM